MYVSHRTASVKQDRKTRDTMGTGNRKEPSSQSSAEAPHLLRAKNCSPINFFRCAGCKHRGGAPFLQRKNNEVAGW